MAYTTINKSTDYFNTKLYTGNGGTQYVTGVGFQPDWLWVKCRSNANGHQLFDVLRTTYSLSSNASDAEANRASDGFTSLDSDGFTMNGSGSGGNTNVSGRTYVGWNWKANGAGSANTDGSITSTVSVNTTAGFSIVKYEASANATIGHGLGVKPAMVITKSRDDSTNWASWHKNLTGGNENDRYVNLNTSAADDNYSNYWGTGGFTSSVFGVSNTGFHNNSNSMIAYCFAEKKGFSKFGKYTGNANADGTFVYTGFKPVFFLFKRIDAVKNWHIVDGTRDIDNPTQTIVYPDLSDAEQSTTSVDFVSNGIKIRNGGSFINETNGTYIYMAFGQSLVGSNNVPCTAR